MTTASRLDSYDVIVIGGGAAGLAAAVALGRSRRSVAVVDAGEPRNAPAAGAHNLLGQEGIAPRELLAVGRKEAAGYGVVFHDDRVVGARRGDDAFAVDLAAGDALLARRLILASGLVDELPDVPGVRELWGSSVLHCPYCHGWEVRDRRIGVLGTGPFAVHQTQLFRQLSEDVTLFTHTTPTVDGETASQLAARGIRVVDGAVREIRASGGEVAAVVLDDGREFDLDAVVVGPRFHARTDLYEQLGGVAAEHPMGWYIETDPTGRTAIPGVWAAGNASDLAAMVSVSAGAGVMAGAAVNADLVADDVARAVGGTGQNRAAW